MINPENGEIPQDMVYSNTDVITRLIHAYIKLSVFDGDESSSTLSKAVVSMQDAAGKLKAIPQVGENSDAMQALREIESSVQESVVTLQFFDRVAQRLMHATYCLKILESVELSSNLDDAFDLKSIYAVLTMDDERKVFDAIMQGDTIKAALQKAKQSLQQTIQNVDDIELF